MLSDKGNIRCLIVDDEPLARDIIENFVSRIEQLELVSTCATAIEAFNLINKYEIDLLFLDIQMPEITGVEFLKELNNPPKVIFTTAFDGYALDAFNLNAVDYLVKPIEFSRFLKAVNKIFERVKISPSVSARYEEKDNYDTVFIYLKVEKSMQKIFLCEILYVESLKNYVKIKTLNREIIAYKSLNSMLDVLPDKKFIRAHRSFVIAKDHIDSFSPSEINLKGNKIPIGRNYKKSVKEILGYF